MKHVEFKKHPPFPCTADGSTTAVAAACSRRRWVPGGIRQRSTGSNARRARRCGAAAARPPSDTFEWYGSPKVKRPPVEVEPPVDAVPEAAPRDCARGAEGGRRHPPGRHRLPGCRRRCHALHKSWSATPSRRRMVAVQGLRLLAGVYAHAHMRDHATCRPPPSRPPPLPRRGDGRPPRPAARGG